MNDNVSNFKQGSLLQGDNVIEKTLGQGGFGITYMGLEVELNRKVAIKEFFIKEYCERDSGTSHVTVGSQGSKEIVERLRAKFVKEAQTIAQLDNPHVIKIYDIFEENDTAYYVMEYIEGESLEEYVNKRQRLDEASAVKFVGQIADALTYIHDKNILHLNVKPSNVMLRESGEAVLIDFDVSKHYDESGEQNSTTLVAISKGYSPIEQYTLGGVSHFNPSTDIYSLGAMLYRLLTGERPEEAPVLINETLTIPPYVSARCASVIRKAMSMKKSSRYQSAAKMKAALCCDGDTEDVTILSVNDDKGKINGREYVDLGLSVKWATCNVGASSPTDYGNYYAWGETIKKREYTMDNSWTHHTMYSFITDNIGGNPYSDVARDKWGGSWRLPTIAEFKELINNCKSEWTTQDGIKGRKFTSNKNGKSIFLPAAGYRDESSLDDAGECGCYWSSTPYNSYLDYDAYELYFGSGNCRTSNNWRYHGQSVRPVSK